MLAVKFTTRLDEAEYNRDSPIYRKTLGGRAQTGSQSPAQPDDPPIPAAPVGGVGP